ncbi:hypothetical protein TRVL_07445 [Trypanosoma vivax]|nr:hypothetical protein TRVL_07445 [Trypanosoma vivax]
MQNTLMPSLVIASSYTAPLGVNMSSSERPGQGLQTLGYTFSSNDELCAADILTNRNTVLLLNIKSSTSFRLARDAVTEKSFRSCEYSCEAFSSVALDISVAVETARMIMEPAICTFSSTQSSTKPMGKVLRMSFTIISTTDLTLSSIIDCTILGMKKLSSSTIAFETLPSSEESSEQTARFRLPSWTETFRTLIFGLLLVSLKMSMMTVKSVLDARPQNSPLMVIE